MLHDFYVAMDLKVDIVEFEMSREVGNGVNRNALRRWILVWDSKHLFVFWRLRLAT